MFHSKFFGAPTFCQLDVSLAVGRTIDYDPEFKGSNPSAATGHGWKYNLDILSDLT